MLITLWEHIIYRTRQAFYVTNTRNIGHVDTAGLSYYFSWNCCDNKHVIGVACRESQSPLQSPYKATLIEISAQYLSTKKSLTEFPVFVSRMFFSKGDWVHFYNSCIFFPYKSLVFICFIIFSNPRTSWSYFWVTWKNAKTNMGKKIKK